MVGYEEGESIFKIDGPIGRWTYIKLLMIITIAAAAAVLAIRFLIGGVTLAVFMLASFVLLLYYLYFVNFAKRYYDITGDKRIGIILSIVCIIIIFILNSSNSVVSLLIFLLPAIIPGKILKKKKS